MRTEARLAEELGVSRDDLGRLRGKMKKGRDWSVRGGTGVVFGDEGVERVTKLLGLAGAAGVAVVEKKEDGAIPEVTLRVVRADYPNRHMVMAEKKEDGAMVRCRVRSADAYVPGMEVAAWHVQEDLFEELRAPRGKRVTG